MQWFLGCIDNPLPQVSPTKLGPQCKLIKFKGDFCLLKATCFVVIYLFFIVQILNSYWPWRKPQYLTNTVIITVKTKAAWLSQCCISDNKFLSTQKRNGAKWILKILKIFVGEERMNKKASTFPKANSLPTENSKWFHETVEYWTLYQSNDVGFPDPEISSKGFLRPKILSWYYLNRDNFWPSVSFLASFQSYF